MKKGYSLIEVIISIALLGIVVMATLQIIPYGMKLNDKSEYMVVATNICKAVLERSSAMSFKEFNVLLSRGPLTDFVTRPVDYTPLSINTLKTNGCTIPLLDASDTSVNHDFLNNNFERLRIERVVLKDTSDPAVPPLAKIIVTLQWKEARSGTTTIHEVSLTTLVTYNNIRL
jgi:prepilin-type N-terminal cleavage/methylation domain-containing protein